MSSLIDESGDVPVGRAPKPSLYSSQPLDAAQTKWRRLMAKGQQKGNREVRKPKSAKPKASAAQDTPFLAKSGMGAATKPPGKKSR